MSGDATTRRAYYVRPLRLLTLGRPLTVHICPLCAALIVADREREHVESHRAQLGGSR